MKKKRPLTPTLRKTLQRAQEQMEEIGLTFRDTVGHRPNKQFVLREKESTLPALALRDGKTRRIPEFELGPLIAKGGMGRVCAAKQLPLQRDVVIKMLREDKRTPAMKALLLQEAYLTGYLEHPNIIPVYQLGKDEEDEPMLVMKQIDGVPWSQLLTRRKKEPDSLPEEQLSLEWHIRILLQVCHAVEYAHSKGIVHRDLKPGNVMIGEFGEVYVLDWGIAASLREEHAGHLPLMKDTNDFMGTPAYSAPEMLMVEIDKIDERTDVYLLGAILFHLLTGQAPHHGKSVVELADRLTQWEPFQFSQDVATELAVLCNLSMSDERHVRPESVREFRLVLETFLANSASHKLMIEAKSMFQQLKEHLDRVLGDEKSSSLVPPSSDEDKEIYSLFWRCHFGFSQALQISAQNKQARKGLQSLLEAMVDYELHRGDVQATAALLTELPRPNRMLEQRLELLKEEQSKKAQNIRELEEFKYESRMDIGRSDRQAGVFILGLSFGLFGILIYFLIDFKYYEPEHLGFFASHLGFVFVLLVMAFVWRASLFKNRANRQFISMVLFLGLTFLLFRGIFIYMEVSIAVACVMDGMLMFILMGFLTITHDIRFGVGATCYLLVCILTMFKPKFYYFALGLAHFVTAPSIAWFWRSYKLENQKARSS